MGVYDFTVKDRKEQMVPISNYKGQVMLIINSATECGFTPQYDELQDLYEKYAQEGFIILDFPCNQFGGQAPGTDEEIASFCDAKFGIRFPIFSKVEVNGENAIPLFRYLVEQKGFGGFDPAHRLSEILDKKLSGEDADYKNKPDIKWNFTKFLVDREGKVIERFEPTTDIFVIEEKIKELLKYGA